MKSISGKTTEAPKELPAIVVKAMTLPAEQTPEKLVEFLSIFDGNSASVEQQQELQAAMMTLQQMPREQVAEALTKVQEAQLAAAKALLAKRSSR